MTRKYRWIVTVGVGVIGFGIPVHLSDNASTFWAFSLYVVGVAVLLWGLSPILPIRISFGSVEYDKQAYRARKIQEWRETVQNWDDGPIYEIPAWSEMRVHLDSDLVKDVESGIEVGPVVTFGREKPSDQQRVLDALARLEREWDII